MALKLGGGKEVSGRGTALDLGSMGDPERLRLRLGERELGETVRVLTGEGGWAGDLVSVSSGVPGESSRDGLFSIPGMGGSFSPPGVSNLGIPLGEGTLPRSGPLYVEELEGEAAAATDGC